MSSLPWAVRIDDELPAEQTHFSDGETAQAYYNAVVRAVWAGRHTKVALLRDGETVSEATRKDREKENEE